MTEDKVMFETSKVKYIQRQRWIETEKKFEYRYLKDGKEITDEKITDEEITDEEITDEEITDPKNTEFLKSIVDDLVKFIEGPFDNVVVLLGAGASIVPGDKTFGKTVSGIAEDVQEQLNEDTDLFNIRELSERSHYNIDVEDDESSTKSLKNFDFEEFLSKLIKYNSYLDNYGDSGEKEKVSASLNKIKEIIRNDTKYDFDSDKMRHGSFLNVVSELIDTDAKINFVTTNYDTMIEDAADAGNYTVFDGFTFSQQPTFDSSMFDWNLIRDVTNMTTNEKVYKKKVINLLKLHGSLTWSMAQKKGSQESLLIKGSKDNESIKVNPEIVYPSSDKYEQSYKEPYFELFAKFQEFLKLPNTLFITAGFSFADDHISRMITNAIKTNESLTTLITDFDVNFEESNENAKSVHKLMREFNKIGMLKATMNDDLVDYLGGKVSEN